MIFLVCLSYLFILLVGFPTGYDAGDCCYYVATFNENEISADTTVAKNDQHASNDWVLLANVSWPLPDTSDEKYSIERYAIDVEELTNRGEQFRPIGEGNCNDCLLQETDTVTDSLWYVFGDLWFGTEYLFSIHLLKDSKHKGIYDFKYTFKTPDCFLSTRGDGDYCQNQNVQIAGMIIDLRLDDIIPEYDGYATALISWIPPVHVRSGSRLVSYTTKYQVISEDTQTVINIQPQNQTNWRKRQSTEITGLKLNETYRLNIEPIVQHEESSPLPPSATSSEITFSTFIVEFGVCSCDGLINYTRICPPNERGCLGNTTQDRACRISDECRTSSEFENYIIAAGIVLLITIACFVCVLKVYCCDGRRTNIESFEKELSMVDPAFKNYEIPSQTQVIWDERKPIGNGRFGMVYSCPLKQEVDGDRRIVAIKTPLETASAAEKMDFKKEIQLMSQIGKHSNVIELIGCRTTKDPMYIITPLMRYGCLLELLRKSSKMKTEGIFAEPIYDLKLKDLFSISRQIAIGMEYISSLRIVHGDLAARNVLIGEGLVAKIGDFGLGQDAYEKGYLRLKDGEVPVKWYSLETLLEHFITPMSDVWSFGILLYELFTFGKSPYPGIIIGTLPQLLQRGYRMQRPEDCPSTAYKIMRSCWHEHPKKRPTFTMLFHQLDTVLEFVTNDSNLYIKLSENDSHTEGGENVESMNDTTWKLDEFELNKTNSAEMLRLIESETYEEESTGQTFRIEEFIPLMETSSQYGGKSRGLTNSLSHYDFNNCPSESTGVSVYDVTFVPEFEDSGGDDGPWSSIDQDIGR